MDDHYKTLGVTPRDDAETIRAAYRRLARQTHPDVNDEPEAHLRFKAVAEAYRVLADPAQRRRYDALRLLLLATPLRYVVDALEDPLRRAGLAAAIARLARKFTAARPRPSRDGADVELNEQLSFVQSFTGHDLDIAYLRSVACAACAGSGLTDHRTCPLCDGRAEIVFPVGGGLRKPCPKCHGLGVVGDGRCGGCHGQALIDQPKKLRVRVPSGVADGAVLRVAGAGHQGRPGGKDGDLLITVRVAGSLHFAREGLDLILERAVPLCVAVGGGKAAVGLPDNTDIEIDIPPGASPGTRLRVPRRGFHSPPQKTHGDLLVDLDVFVPDDFDHHQRLLAGEWLDAARRGDHAGAQALAAQLADAMEGKVCSDDSVMF
jgi:molecular chaperone DnaJ